MRRGRTWAWVAGGLGALAAAVVVVVLAVANTQRTAAPYVPPPPPTATEQPQPTTPPPPPPGPPVLVVKIDNVPEARPPLGIAAADMIFVEPVEGGLSRLAAVFAAHQPTVVGPVRSARETDLELLPQFGHPTLAFSGAAPELLPLIDRAPLEDASQPKLPDAYFRDNSRSIPHNLFARPNRLPPGAGWSANTLPQFGAAPPGGTPSGHQEVRYSSASVGFDWSAAEGRWLVSMDGKPYSAGDTGRLGPSTVVLQSVPVRESRFSDSAGNVSPFASSVGSGHAVVLRDGQAFEANWSRPAPDAGTTYTTSTGQPLPFAPGQVWVVLAPA
jgi:hypothetical protein